jgi:hypothetical protein
MDEDAKKAQRFATFNMFFNAVQTVLTLIVLPVALWFLNDGAKARDKERDNKFQEDMKVFDQNSQTATLQAVRRAKEVDVRTDLVLKLFPTVLGTTGKLENCELVLAEWGALYPDAPDMVRGVSEKCPGKTNSPVAPPSDWGISIGTDALLVGACDEVMRARKAGYKVDVYYFPTDRRYQTVLYGFADRSAAALAEIAVRAQIRPGVVGDMPNLTAGGQRKDCPAAP